MTTIDPWTRYQRILARRKFLQERANKIHSDLIELDQKLLEASHRVAARLEADGCTSATPREGQVLSLLRLGKANKEIGNTLNITERTVKFHVSGLLKKYGVQNRNDLPGMRLHSFLGK